MSWQCPFIVGGLPEEDDYMLFFTCAKSLARKFSLHKLFTAWMVVKSEYEPAEADQSLLLLLRRHRMCGVTARARCPVHVNTVVL